VIADDSWPISFASTVEEMPRSIVCDAKACRIEWNEAPSSRSGLPHELLADLRYLNNQGIRLDRKPDEFVEEAMAYNPTLIVLDSLTRLHTDDENAAGAMSTSTTTASSRCSRNGRSFHHHAELVQ